MKMKKLLTILLAASIVAGSAQVPGLTMQVQAAQVQTQESAGSATATYNGKTFNRASAAYQDGDVSYEGMPLYNGNAEDLMCGAPNQVTEQQLREVHIKVRD